MMIEAITQAGAWLVWVTEQFKHSVILLKEAKTVKFGQFVTPGKQLQVTCELLDDDGENTILKAQGVIDGRTSVSAKLILLRFNLRDRHPGYRREDLRLKAHHLQTFHMLAGPELREKLRERASAELSLERPQTC
jgi:3-hydroxyacyl-[acyl-carrier-protein] dehydratase